MKACARKIRRAGRAVLWRGTRCVVARDALCCGAGRAVLWRGTRCVVARDALCCGAGRAMNAWVSVCVVPSAFVAHVPHAQVTVLGSHSPDRSFGGRGYVMSMCRSVSKRRPLTGCPLSPASSLGRWSCAFALLLAQGATGCGIFCKRLPISSGIEFARFGQGRARLFRIFAESDCAEVPPGRRCLTCGVTLRGRFGRHTGAEQRLLVWRRALIDWWVGHRGRQLRRDERPTNPMI